MKVLFFGLGGIGQRHLRNLLAVEPDAQVAAVRKSGRTFEITSQLQADHAVDIHEKYGIEVYTNLHDALAFKPDFAVVANATCAHVETTRALLENRIPVFLEKPVSDSLEGVDDLVRLSRASDVPVMVGYMLRFHPGVQKLKELVDARAVGRLYSVDIQLSSFMPDWHPYEECSDFYAGRSDLGGGAILTEIHEIDLLHWMLGAPKRLWCVGGKLSPFEIDVEDTVSTLMQYDVEGGVVPVTISMSFVRQPIGRTITIFGERGRIGWDLLQARLVVDEEVQGSRTTFAYPSFERNEMFIREMSHFMRGLVEGVKPMASLEEVIGGHRMALRMKESLDCGCVVNL
jgi:predicted dehydrogenase